MLAELARWLFDPSGLTPHGCCLTWEPWLIWTHALADVAIGLAYFSIPLALAVFARRRRDLVFRPVFWLFAAFILLCGTGHWVDLLTLWVPAYGAEAVVKALTATVSVGTAVALWPLMPKALKLPSPKQMRAVNARLRESEARLRDSYAHTPFPLHTLDANGTILAVSDRWLDLLGYAREEVVGHNISGFLEPASCSRMREEWASILMRQGVLFDARRRLVCRDGRVLDLLACCRVERAGDGTVRVLSALTDVTERLRAEAKLAENEARLRDRFRKAPVPMHILDQNGIILDVSDRWLAMLGYERDEVVGRTAGDFLMPDSGAAMRAEIGPVFRHETEVTEYERRFVRRDGAVIDTVVSVSIERPEGGSPPHMISAVTDVTARRRAEAALRASEERLHQSQKMEAIGQLTGGVAHDFNNVLQAVRGNLEIARRRVREGRTDIDRLLDNALEATGKAAGLTAQLLAFARRQRLDPQPLDPAEVVEGMRGLLARTVGARIALRVEADPGAGACLADRNQLESALLNLAINARDAIGGAAGTVTVSVRTERVEAAPEGWPPDSEYLRIAVRDDGPGMPEEVRRRAFEPFFTTKAPGKGTGLGLAQIHGFAHQSGGTVRIESAPGQGTEVAILLPKASGEARVAAPRAQEPEEAEAGSGETVLVVEDDPLVRAALAETLRDLGYRVVDAADAEIALTMLDYGIAAEAVVTDLTMPGGMDGLDLAAAVRERCPAMPLVMVTGHADALRGRALPSGLEVLRKPHGRTGIAAALRRTLDGKAAAAA